MTKIRPSCTRWTMLYHSNHSDLPMFGPAIWVWSQSQGYEYQHHPLPRRPLTCSLVAERFSSYTDGPFAKHEESKQAQNMDGVVIICHLY